jgi:hypothetical protein
MSVTTSLCQITFTYFVLRKISSAKSSHGSLTGNADSEDFSLQLPAFNREGFTIAFVEATTTRRKSTMCSTTRSERAWWSMRIRGRFEEN